MQMYVCIRAGAGPYMKLQTSIIHVWECWHHILYVHWTNADVCVHEGRRRPIFETSGLDYPILEMLAPYFICPLCKCRCMCAYAPAPAHIWKFRPRLCIFGSAGTLFYVSIVQIQMYVCICSRRRPIYETSDLDYPFLGVLAPYLICPLCKCRCMCA